MNKRIVIAVDGPAGSGKSSVCKRVAADLGLQYIDSGAIYRAITWFFMDKYGDPAKVENPVLSLRDVTFSQVFDSSGKSRTFVNDKDVSLLIREESVAKNISIFSENSEVRDFVNAMLRSWASKESIIMDGRDIGTVVFPDADLKIYLDASVDVRTERRVKEYSDLGKNVDENYIRNQIIQRDDKDKSRQLAPLVKAWDAVYIDTSQLSFEEVVEKIKELIKRL
ncbi:MAG TPA: (d)CMP kinase [Spirochaetota bacterium]|nr:(d)CMP kinase [Spirochaetota bacterium]HOK91633.1 (d)CMP kinase [Spirochaetota bacterium]HON15910.1 (d)CMP kinase [Spirochaetota bacterium]HPD78702.1 (d)CMP kinase [Spirochaetota bacterium]HPP94731.1 (d)CMP kinase [Spirochaetota bacterium]